MRDPDVIEHIRATFAPLILSKTVQRRRRHRLRRSQHLSTWKPYQATSNDKRPALPAERTMFNLVPCDNDFEQRFTDFLDTAQDVVAFAKNAGPQKLMIDYLKPDGHRALYVPDFIVHTRSGAYYLVELKGRRDESVPWKAAAAIEWCEVASQGGTPWHYLYVPYALFQRSTTATIETLARACEPSLQELLQEVKGQQLSLPLAEVRRQAEATFQQVLQEAGITHLPPRWRRRCAMPSGFWRRHPTTIH